MKMFTNSDQTAKLIEMGFKPPMWRVARKFDDQPPRKIITSFGELRTASYEDVYAYSIGELIEMLPEDIEDKDNRGIWYFRNITGISVYYSREERMYWTDLYISCLNEALIDNLYDMVVKLKEEEII